LFTFIETGELTAVVYGGVIGKLNPAVVKERFNCV
jgi:hypothetical protein